MRGELRHFPLPDRFADGMSVIAVVPVPASARARAPETLRIVAALAGLFPGRGIATLEKTPPPPVESAPGEAPSAHRRRVDRQLQQWATREEARLKDAWAGRYREVLRYCLLLSRTLAALDPLVTQGRPNFDKAVAAARPKGGGPRDIDALLTGISEVAIALRETAMIESGAGTSGTLPELRHALAAIAPLVPATVHALPWSEQGKAQWVTAAEEIVAVARTVSTYLPILNDPGADLVPPTQRQAQRIFERIASTAVGRLDRKPLHLLRHDVRELHRELLEAAKALYLASTAPDEAA